MDLEKESNHHGDDDSAQDELQEHDALLSFQLRARLANMNFSRFIWRVMPKLGWKYINSKAEYVAPNGINFGTSKQAMEKLDRYALEPLMFQNVWKKNVDCLEQNDDDHIEMKKLREDLLTAIFYQCKKTGDALPCFYFDESDGEEEVDDENDSTGIGAKTKQESRVRKLTTTNRSSSFKSATANEKGTDEYFEGNKPKSHKTKSGQNARPKDDGILKWPSPQECVKNVLELTDTVEIKKARQTTESHVKCHGEEWKFLLSTNHSLLLYGYGSKKYLLDNFAKAYLNTDGGVLTLNGYDPQINITQILDILVHLFLNGIEPAPIHQLDVNEQMRGPPIGMFQSPLELCSATVRRAVGIAKALGTQCPRPIYLVIHNIDGVGLRSRDGQRALSVLVTHSVALHGHFSKGETFQDQRIVRIAASTDHVDTSMFLWDLETMNNFSWIWKEVHTYEPYFDEIAKGIKENFKSIKTVQRESVNFVFMKKVLKSLASKHTTIFNELAKMQLSEGKPNRKLGEYDYVNFEEWKHVCLKKAFIVMSESSFDVMMRELIDHHIIQKYEDFSAKITYVCIPTKKENVQEIVNSLNSSK